MRAFAKDRVTVVSSEEEWENVLSRAGGQLLVAEFAASWSVPCKSMVPFVTALSQQPEFQHVRFVRLDIEACPALGAKNSVLSAPTYHFYREGKLLDSFSGAVPQKLMELLAKHKGDAPRRGPWVLLALLAGVAGAGAWAIASAMRDVSAPEPPAPPPAGTALAADAAPGVAEVDALPGPPAAEGAARAPAKKASAAPSKGARRG